MMKKIRLVRNSLTTKSVEELQEGDIIQLSIYYYPKIITKLKEKPYIKETSRYSTGVINKWLISTYNSTFIYGVRPDESSSFKVVTNPYSQPTMSWVWGDMPGEIYADYLEETVQVPSNFKSYKDVYRKVKKAKSIKEKEIIAYKLSKAGYRV